MKEWGYELDGSHIGFADESHWNTGRFRSLGLVTCGTDDREGIESEIRHLLADSNVCEFKWKDVVGARERFAAEKLCEFAAHQACEGNLRTDVLVWDIEDCRHKVARRDDIANLERMYYHLFRNVLRMRWPDKAVWRLHPDEHTGLNWETLEDCLEAAGARIHVEHSLFSVRLRREFGVEEIQPVTSAAHPMLQLADLFAGLAVFSREKYDDYQSWKAKIDTQGLLFDEDQCAPNPSRSMGERFPVLDRFDRLCKNRKLGISLKTNRGLWTPNPENALNFWMYEPQHPEDKAPRRGSA